jgi:hypothetical protein
MREDEFTEGVVLKSKVSSVSPSSPNLVKGARSTEHKRTRVKPFTVPPFMVMTSCAEAPYMVNLVPAALVFASQREVMGEPYPAAINSVPGINKSSGLGLPPVTLSGNFMIPKIVPTLTPASRLLEPSIGSQATTYLALGLSSKYMMSSSSSETSALQRPDPRMAAINRSFPMTSSFFWSSPVVLEEPARPVRLISVARRM